MPELPEVRTVVAYMDEKIKNTKIINLNLYYPKLVKNSNESELKNKLIGQTFLGVHAIGKFILIKTENNDLVSHLRMEGKWVVENTGEHYYKTSWLEISFELNNGKSLNYYDSRKFGTLEIYETGEGKQKSSIRKLGPEPFDISNEAFETIFSKLQRSKTAIKKSLLDQSLISGLGNIYVNEVLFSCKIHPERPSNKVSRKEIEEIISNSIRILNASIAIGGTTIHSFGFGEDNQGNFQEMLKIHGKNGEKCIYCGKNILKIFVGGRGTYYCENCQK